MAKQSKRRRTLLFNREHGSCWYCCLDIHIDTFHADHQTPKSLGGSGDFSNLVASCPECNLRKGNKDLEQYRTYMSHIMAKFEPFTEKQIARMESLGVSPDVYTPEPMKFYGEFDYDTKS